MSVYYCEIQVSHKQYKPGVYAIDSKKSSYFQCLALSNRAWIEDDKGVRWAKHRGKDIQVHPVLSKDELKEFVWAKLKAQFIT
jgi:hypothetical protein